MKVLATLVFGLIFLGNAHAVAPRCVNNYWVSPDFVLFTGGESCEDRVAACSLIGTKSEGWYSYAVSSERRLSYSSCEYDYEENIMPTCEHVGTKSEGWYVAGSVMLWSKCSDQEVVCTKIGTRSEGWYTYSKSSRNMIIWADCSGDF